MLQEPVFKLGYIIQIFNSQHGWILIMVIITNIWWLRFSKPIQKMAVISSSRSTSLQQGAWYNIDAKHSVTPSRQWIWFYSTMEGIVPSRCRHLGATLFKLRLLQVCKSHVTSSMHHDTWGLMQVSFHIIMLSTDPIISGRWAGLPSFSKSQPNIILLSWPLGATHCSSLLLKLALVFPLKRKGWCDKVEISISFS